MGWDAFANTDRHRAKFRAVAKRVAAKCGSVDGFLENGGLDCSACAFALQDATGACVWDEDGWSAKKVRRLAEKASWPEDVDEDRRWAAESAKAFLNLCARIGVGISFSY